MVHVKAIFLQESCNTFIKLDKTKQFFSYNVLTGFLSTDLLHMEIGPHVATSARSSAETENHFNDVAQSKVYSSISKPGA